MESTYTIKRPGYESVTCDKPLPCPFCGSEPELVQLAHAYRTSRRGKPEKNCSHCINENTDRRYILVQMPEVLVYIRQAPTHRCCCGKSLEHEDCGMTDQAWLMRLEKADGTVSMSDFAAKQIAEYVRELQERASVPLKDGEAQMRLMNAVETILDSLCSWEGEANHAAQVDQDYRSYRHVMRTKIAVCLWRAMGWPE